MMRLGIIADDFTGATDIAGFLVANGLSTIQLNGVPDNCFRSKPTPSSSASSRAPARSMRPSP